MFCVYPNVSPGTQTLIGRAKKAGTALFIAATLTSLSETLTKRSGGSETGNDFPLFPSVVSVRRNSDESHLVLSSPIEPMLEN